MYLYVYCTLAAAKKGYTLLQRRSAGRQSHTNPHKPMTAMMINVRRLQRNIYHLYRTTKINNHKYYRRPHAECIQFDLRAASLGVVEPLVDSWCYVIVVIFFLLEAKKNTVAMVLGRDTTSTRDFVNIHWQLYVIIC